DCHRMQAILDVLADLPVAEAARPGGEVARKRAKPKAGRDAIRTDGVPNRDALDEGFPVFGHLVDQLVDSSLIHVPLHLALAIVLPDQLELVETGLPRNTVNGANDAGQGAGRVGAAREAEDVNLIGALPALLCIPIE